MLLRLFHGDGRLPDALRAEVEAEGVKLLAEALRGTVTLRDYRSPRRRSSWKKMSAHGAIAITSGRLVVWANRMKWIDVPLPAPPEALSASLDEPERVCVAVDAGAFSADTTGRVEVRFATPEAQQVVALLS